MTEVNTDIPAVAVEASLFKEIIRSGVWTVQFVKANGSIRDMEATLDQSMIPEEHIPKSEKSQASDKTAHTVTNNEYRGLVRVFDVEAQGWRTVNLNTLIEYHPTVKV